MNPTMTTNSRPTSTPQPTNTTERITARAASWLTDRSAAQRWTRMTTKVLYAERYATVLFRAFVAVLAVRLRRPTARVSPFGLCWRTTGGRLEHLRCEPYLVPSELEPHRPLLVRVVVNKGPVEDVELAARDCCLLPDDVEPRPPLWSLELVVMPGELLRFAPYLVQLVLAFEANGDDGEETVVEPPVPTTLVEEHDGLWATRTLYEWTERARAILEARAWKDEHVPASVAARALTNQRRSPRR